MFRQIPSESDDENTGRSCNDTVVAYLNDRFSETDRPLGRLDRWTQQSISVLSQEKVDRVLNSANQAEQCYALLVKDINEEARHGIFLSTPAGHVAQLQRLAGQPGKSGRLFQHLPGIAPPMFAEELEHAGGKLDMVCTVIEARYDRANLDAEVCELILMHLLDSADDAADIADELRRTFYNYHEDQVRSRCELPRLLNEHTAQRVANDVHGMLERSRRFTEAMAV